jgi:mRNA-degrading endonuclease RelE of RelBE toxin-antitoxin system
MIGMWQVGFTGKAAKQLHKLPKDIQAAVSALTAELQIRGPMLPEWKHFGKLRGQGESFHCHIKSGRPTYVACWEVINKRIRILEVYYVGTHENAPY